MKSKLPLLFTILYISIITIYSNTAAATLMYSDKFEATNDPLVVGYQFYWVGHYAEEDYLNTGLVFADQLALDLNVRDLPNSGSFDLEILLNDILIGGFATGDLTKSINNLVFNFAEVESASKNWTLTMRVATPACGGCGGLWLENLHDFSLVSTTSVSEPSSLAILMLALVGFITRGKHFSSQKRSQSQK